MDHIETTMFNEPSGNVRGVAIALVPVTRKRGKKFVEENIRLAHATLFTDQPPAITLGLSGGATIDNLPLIASVMSDFHATLSELDKGRIEAE